MCYGYDIIISANVPSIRCSFSVMVSLVYDIKLSRLDRFLHFMTDWCKSWQITGNLVKSKLKVDEQYVHVIPMNTQCTVQGVKVTLLDANQ